MWSKCMSAPCLLLDKASFTHTYTRTYAGLYRLLLLLLTNFSCAFCCTTIVCTSNLASSLNAAHFSIHILQEADPITLESCSFGLRGLPPSLFTINVKSTNCAS